MAANQSSQNKSCETPINHDIGVWKVLLASQPITKALLASWCSIWTIWTSAPIAGVLLHKFISFLLVEFRPILQSICIFLTIYIHVVRVYIVRRAQYTYGNTQYTSGNSQYTFPKRVYKIFLWLWTRNRTCLRGRVVEEK